VKLGIHTGYAAYIFGLQRAKNAIAGQILRKIYLKATNLDFMVQLFIDENIGRGTCRPFSSISNVALAVLVTLTKCSEEV